VLLVSLPSTLQFFAWQGKHAQMFWLAPAERELVHFMRGTPPGAVAWARPEIAEALIALTHCRAAVFTVHPWWAFKAPDLERRRAELDLFWSEWSAGRLRRELVEAFGARWIVADKRLHGAGPESPAGLRKAWENERYVVLELSP
jgi:hypothetical protein